MKIQYIIKSVLLSALAISIIAPFTFMKPEQKFTALIDVKVKDVVKKEPLTKKITVERPLHNVKIPDFSSIRDIKTKKREFFQYIYPAIEEENSKLLILRSEVEIMIEVLFLEENLSEDQQRLLNSLIKNYKVSEKYSLLQQLNELQLRIDIIPIELVLVQAANESAWGTSRFAKIGLNFFGMWCYKKGCGMVPNGRDTGAKHEVAAFNSLDHAVKRYLHNINTNNAYSVLRTIRGQLRAQGQPLSIHYSRHSFGNPT